MLRSKLAALFAIGSLATAGAVGCAADRNVVNEPAKMSAMADMAQTTTTFSGAKANTGTVTAVHKDGKIVLTWSDDFTIPDTPAPHWQVVDTHGNVYLLQRLKIKGDKLNRSIVLPSYIKDVAKVQVWCAYAEVLLGEGNFASPVM